MSVWTHVNATICSKNKISKTILEETFGQEMRLEYPEIEDYMSRDENGIHFDEDTYQKESDKANENNMREWENYDANPSVYLPCGSEGTLTYDPMKKVGDKYEVFQYGISGALRDYDDEDGIIKWFRDKFFDLERKVAPEDPWAIHGKITASSGVGQLTWEINNPKWFEV